jgi:hypothetical protein
MFIPTHHSILNSARLLKAEKKKYLSVSKIVQSAKLFLSLLFKEIYVLTVLKCILCSIYHSPIRRSGSNCSYIYCKQ